MRASFLKQEIAQNVNHSALVVGRQSARFRGSHQQTAAGHAARAEFDAEFMECGVALVKADPHTARLCLVAQALQHVAITVEQPVARRVAVAQHLAGVAIGAARRQRAGDVVAQVRPAQPQAALQAASAAPARVGLHAFALAIRVMAKAPVALAAEAHARIQPAFDAGRARRSP